MHSQFERVPNPLNLAEEEREIKSSPYCSQKASFNLMHLLIEQIFFFSFLNLRHFAVALVLFASSL